jgi:hypothetical protein
MTDIPFDNSFVGLPGSFYARVTPTPVFAPQLVRLNIDLALQLGLDPSSLASPEGVEVRNSSASIPASINSASSGGPGRRTACPGTIHDPPTQALTQSEGTLSPTEPQIAPNEILRAAMQAEMLRSAASLRAP